jgi:hypothetical protein
VSKMRLKSLKAAPRITGSCLLWTQENEMRICTATSRERSSVEVRSMSRESAILVHRSLAYSALA